MKKFEFYEIPYLGIKAEEDKDSYFYGMTEALSPDCEVTFHLGKKTKVGFKKEAREYLSSRSGKTGMIGPAVGTAFFGIVFWPLAPLFVGWGWKQTGRNRVYKKAIEYAKEEKFDTEEVDLEEFYDIGEKQNLESHIEEYTKLGNIRDEELGEGAGGWLRSKFSKFENERMAKYREEFIIPVFEELEDVARKKWDATGNKAHRHVYKEYQTFSKKIKERNRLRSNPFDWNY